MEVVFVEIDEYDMMKIPDIVFIYIVVSVSRNRSSVFTLLFQFLEMEALYQS